MLRRLQRLLTQFDDALDWMEDDPLLSTYEPPADWAEAARARPVEAVAL
jgi:hypothetical protein